MPRQCNSSASTARGQAQAERTRELQERAAEFAGKADPAELEALLRILRRYPEMRACTRHALFASVIAEYRAVVDVLNVPGPRALFQYPPECSG